MSNILLVEDDQSIVKNLTEFLCNEGFSVHIAAGQTEAIEKIQQNMYDLYLLDISLADGNGFAICSYIKSISDTPVIFLTASGDEYSVVMGLDIGADDYISKPFRPRELISRIRSVLRRSGHGQAMLTYGDLRVDTTRAMVQKAGLELTLSALEYRLLLALLSNQGMVLTRTKLLEEIWDIGGDFVNDNTLTVYIKRLRDKIEADPQNPKIIKTIRGFGYKVGE